MTPQGTTPSAGQQAVIDRFVAACEADPRVVAAFLGGSLAAGTADAYSDLDLYLITTDAAYEAVVAEGRTFMDQLGGPAFLEDWTVGGRHYLNFIFADGVEGELGLSPASAFDQIHAGPFRVLVDKTGILAGARFPGAVAAPDAQREVLRGLLNWFWHNLSHFTTALGRDELWAAAGALDDLRRACVDLAHLRHDFTAAPQGFEKLERVLPVAAVAPLAPTFVPLERAAMLAAGRAVLAFYLDLAPRLAAAHEIAYPADLAPLFAARLETLDLSSGKAPG
ncbi:MAG TPA: aminoglycoside 6-adenylyltransferase [Chloroflexia bacterium]|nr:aminoglycoside 6-adenylyltransferase [Chloroflexia bacterium]